MFVTQVVGQSLPTPEARGSNPVIGILLYSEHWFSTDLKRRKRGEYFNFS